MAESARKVQVNRGAALGLAALVTGLGLPAVAPEVSNVSYFVCAALGLASGIFNRSLIGAGPATLAAIAAGMLLAVSTVLATGRPIEAVPALYFLSAYLALFYAVALDRPPLAAVGLAAAAGCLAALAVALYDAFILALPGPGTSVNNPIHFAALVLTLSFVSMVGLYDRRLVVKTLAGVGALAGLVALWLSGARGPMIALPPMLAVGLLVVIWQRLTLLPRMAVLGGLAVAAGLAMWSVWWGRSLDTAGPFADMMLLLREGKITDHSTWERVTMYQSAWNALVASPLFGHGLGNIPATAAAFAPPGVEAPIYEHLHSDTADFGVAGGAMGLVAYLAFLVMPLLAASWRDRSPFGQASRFLALTVCTGYVFMGLTNAMLGILTQTVLYSAITAILLAWSEGARADGVTREDPAT